ncbi:MAG: LemA family protein [Prevotellaceae bacterium]|nr:LemA family protein [Candidatus Colivivens equi]MCQ2077185.1 LemA family protein [Bacteroidaceae bacterium]
MKKGTLILIAVVVIAVIWGISVYNGLVNKDEVVSQAWSNVETQYQRRADLIPNLVNTVKGYAQHEENTFKEITEARTRATSINIDPTNMTEEDLQKFQQAQSEVGSALSRLIAVAENYPELKASENFQELQTQLEGTENRIQKSRTDFNEAVKEYNVSVRRFPGNIIASMSGFDTKANFKSEEGSDKAPSVEF